MSRRLSSRRPALHGRAFTLVELLVVIAVITVLIGLLVPALQGARKRAQALEDATKIREIHQAMLVFAGDNDGILPTPGLINRRPDAFLNRDVPGTGPEDVTKNTSAALYACMLAQQLVPEELLVSPAEVNPRIPDLGERSYVYDYAAYQPTLDIYWDGDVPTGQAATDEGFQANIEDGISYTSYYHLALANQRKRTMWRSDAGDKVPLLSSRAPYRGTDSSDPDFDRSWTLLLHGSKNAWAGVMVLGDNHIENIEVSTPPNIFYDTDAGPMRDNIFDIDANPSSSGEAFLAMTKSIDESNDEAEDYIEELRQ